MVYTGFVKSLFLSESSYWFRLNNIIPTSFWSVFIKPSILFVFVFLFPRHNLFWWTLRIPSDRFCLIYHWLNINHMEIEELCCRRSVLSGLRRKFTAKILSEEMELKWGWELLLLFEEIDRQLKTITRLAPVLMSKELSWCLVCSPAALKKFYFSAPFVTYVLSRVGNTCFKRWLHFAKPYQLLMGFF